MEALKNNLKEQDKRIEDLQEKVNILEAQVRRASIVYFGVNVSVCMFSVNQSPCKLFIMVGEHVAGSYNIH